MNLPVMCRGLSPEGRRNRERHQGSLKIGLQGITVHPTDTGKNNNFIQENVKRLHEIQTRCKERESRRKCQPLKALRGSSASTNSSVQIEDYTSTKNGGSRNFKRNHSAERGGSALSDYYSLSEDQLDLQLPQQPPHSVFNHDQVTSKVDFSPVEQLRRGLPQDTQCITQMRPSVSPVKVISRGGYTRPPALKPLTPDAVPPLSLNVNSPFQSTSETSQLFSSDAPLSEEMRKLRIGTLMSKIQTQRPACEVDYNMHYKTIEQQHKMLFDSSDKLSTCASGDGSSRLESDTHHSGRDRGATSRPTSSRLLRGRSFDRDLINKKSDTVQMQPLHTSKTSKEGRTSKAKIKPSPKLKRRLSQSNDTLHKTHPATSLPHEQAATKFSASENKCTIPNVYPHRENSAEISIDEHYTNLGDFNTERNNSLESPQTFPDADNSFDIHSDMLSSLSQVDDANLYSDGQALHNDLHYTSAPAHSFSTNGQDQSQGPQHEPYTAGTNSEGIRGCAELAGQECDPSYAGDCPQVDQCGGDGAQLDQCGGDGAQLDQCGVGATCNSATAVQQTHSDQHLQSSTTNYRAERSGQRAKGVGRRGAGPTTSSSPTRPQKKEQARAPDSSRSTLRRSQSLKNMQQRSADVPHTYKKGKIPRYILARKEEQRRLAELAKAVDPDCPPGHTPLPDQERRNTLHLLEKSQSEVLQELSTLPVAQDTLRVKNLRKCLEDKLIQIEDGLRIFSQPKVYIMNDD